MLHMRQTVNYSRRNAREAPYDTPFKGVYYCL